MAIDYSPHPYQRHATEMILEKPYVGLFLQMGLGKTVSTLTAVEQLLFDSMQSRKVLVVAPKRVANETWPDEIEKWQHLKHLKVSVITGTAKQRLKAIETKADIYTIGRDNVPWLVSMFPGRKWQWDTVVLDELSSFKNESSQRFRALRSVRPFMRRVIGLTGTPAPNGLIDLYSQIYLLDRGQRLGEKIGHFKTIYFDASREYAAASPYATKYKIKDGAEQKIYEKIGDICFSMKAEDYLDLPERIDRTVSIKLSPEAQAAYDKMERDFLLPFADGDVEAVNAAALSNKLLQIANGAVYDENQEVKEIHNEKLDALDELIEAANGRPVMVFYAFKHDLDRIKKRIKGVRELKTKKDSEDWNAGKIPVLLLHPASAGHGLNLQKSGGNTIIWYSSPWSLELYQQSCARLHRQGVEVENVIVHHIVVKDSIDEDVIRKLEGKEERQDALLEAVKARIDKVKKRAALN